MGSPMNPLPTTMAHNFSRVPQAEIQRSSFDRSFSVKTAFDSGYLIPLFVDEVLPGDTFNVNLNGFARITSPLKYPIMDNLHMDTQFWFVPLRLIHDNFKRMMGEQANPDDSIDFLTPICVTPDPGGCAVGSLQDYMDVPPGVGALNYVSYFQRAYNFVWNEFYRDQNLQDSVVVDKGNGPDLFTDYVLLKRGKRHDYFTSCLPWPQKGDAVEIALGGQAPVTYSRHGAAAVYRADTGDEYGPLEAGLADTLISDSGLTVGWPLTLGFQDTYADLTGLSPISINELREAFQLQRLLERDARGGTRYTELVHSHFGVVSPDARLQRPEYLGGGTSRVNVHPVEQTAPPVAGSTGLGSLAAFGTAGLSGRHGFSKSFTEHGVVLCLASVRADLNYQQGLPKMYSRRTKYDFYWPALAHLGEQAVLNREIYAQGNSPDNGVFGYQERYAEYRYGKSRITGIMRSQAPLSMDAWHLAQEFANLPVLGDEFIQENVPMDRVTAITDQPEFIFDGWINMKCARPMPTYGVPGMIDHF